MESNKYIDRIDCLKQLPQDVNKFLMMEPLLSDMPKLDLDGIHWVVVGGETNKKKKFREMKEEWVINIRDQVKSAGLPFMFKHWHGKTHNTKEALLEGKIWAEYPDSIENNMDRRGGSMEIIYETKGMAKEYAPLGVNLYLGCTHGCTYCYAPKTLRRKRDDFKTKIQFRNKVLEKLAKDAEALNEKGDKREILLSFETDIYQPLDEDKDITRQAIEILIKNNLKFTILTKGGTRAVRDFDLLESLDAML